MMTTIAPGESGSTTSQRAPLGMIPAPIRVSPLLRRGGFDVFEGLMDERARELLLSEAMGCFAAAEASDVPLSDDEEVRGGSPARRFLSATAGPIQAALYRAPWMLDFLREVSGAPVHPSGEIGTYTYYVRAGDHLAIHRDVEWCDLAVITCLSDEPDVVGLGGMLCLYPERLSEPLSAIRAAPEHGAVRLRLLPRQTIIMLGGIVPHAVLPITNGQERTVSVLCYRVNP
jgi:hypothetical protein